MTYIKKKKQTTYRGDDLQGIRVATHHPRVVHEVGIADGLLLPAARTTPAVTEAHPGGGAPTCRKTSAPRGQGPSSPLALTAGRPRAAAGTCCGRAGRGAGCSSSRGWRPGPQPPGAGRAAWRAAVSLKPRPNATVSKAAAPSRP